MRAVVDLNVIVSGLMVSAGPSGQVLAAWEARRFQLVTSAVLIEQLVNVLGRPKIERRIQEPDAARRFLRTLNRFGVVVDPDFQLSVARDADDNRVLEGAVAGAADVIVSGDDDLQSLRVYEGILIASPVAFLLMLGEASTSDA
ncbi:MAG: putative toxin-antitoxin system toxin component, PIN family [Tepidiformaceae bacterium]